MSSETRFSSLKKLLERHGWSLTRISGSHHVFTKPGNLPISVPVHGKRVKAVYVRKIEKIVEKPRQD